MPSLRDCSELQRTLMVEAAIKEEGAYVGDDRKLLTAVSQLRAWGLMFPNPDMSALRYWKLTESGLLALANIG